MPKSKIKNSPPPKLHNVWWLTKSSVQIFWRYKKMFIGLAVIYGLLNLLLVKGFSSGSGDVSTIKQGFSQVFTGHFRGLFSGLTVFVLLLGSSGNSTSQTAGAYQIFLMLLTSLAIIWTLRHVMGSKKTVRLRIRDTFYKGVYPLIPFILVLLVIGLQLIPMVLGISLYSNVVVNGIAVAGVEKVLWALLTILLSVLSLYMVCSSLFALYIVTLPDMTPMKALRSARELVRFRRLSILRKLVFLPIALLVVAAIIMLPIIAWITPIAAWTFFILTMFALVAVHIYIYTLYRELLNE